VIQFFLQSPLDDEFKTLCQPYLTAENMEFLKNEHEQVKKAFHLHNIIASSTILAKFHVDLGYPLAKHSFKLLDSLVVTDPEKSEVLDYFLANGVDINAKNSGNETALLSEIRKVPWNKKTVMKIQLLLKHGASFPDKDDLGDVPLNAASFSQGLPVDYLLASSPKKMPDVNLVELRQKNNANI
jgi:ankyrin repeat protein